MATTYLTTDELSSRIKYDVRTIRERMVDSVLIEGLHYIRPFGGRKILYIWERIEEDMALASSGSSFSVQVRNDEVSERENSFGKGFVIPMANGGACRVGHAVTEGKKVKRESQACQEGRHGKH